MLFIPVKRSFVEITTLAYEYLYVGPRVATTYWIYIAGQPPTDWGILATPRAQTRRRVWLMELNSLFPRTIELGVKILLVFNPLTHGG